MDSQQRRTAEGNRGDRKAEAADVLQAAIDAAGLTQEEYASQAGVSRAKVRAWLDRDDGGSPPPLDAAMVPSVAEHAVRAQAARVGMVAIKLPTDVGDACTIRELAVCAKEGGEAIAVGLAAIADGHIDRRERVAMIAQLRKSAEAELRLVERLMRDEAEASVRVLGVAK